MANRACHKLSCQRARKRGRKNSRSILMPVLVVQMQRRGYRRTHGGLHQFLSSEDVAEGRRRSSPSKRLSYDVSVTLSMGSTTELSSSGSLGMRSNSIRRLMISVVSASEPIVSK